MALDAVNELTVQTSINDTKTRTVGQNMSSSFYLF